MNKLDFAAINAALDAGTLVPQWLPDGKKRGAEWVALNPIRGDKTPGSFTINLVQGVWKDYASGDGGSDLVSLYAYLFHGNDQGAAAKELADEYGGTRQAPPANVTKIEAAKPTPIMPVPAGVPAATFKHPDHGEPNATWEYRDADGQLLMYVCRFDPEGERKQIAPRSWCSHPGKPSRWTWRGITGQAKRPLYGLDRLAALPDADVILVEGEKAADAGQQLMDGAAVVVSWMGGVETADRVNVKPLAGRRVVLFPDHDALTAKDSDELLPFHEQPAIRAMMNLAASLKGVAREVVMVGYTPVRESHGWDLADALEAGWDGKKVLRYIGKNAGDPMHIAKGPAKPPTNDNEPPAPNVSLDCAVNKFGFPHQTEKGQPMNSVENLEYLLGEYGITTRYNVISKDVEITIPGAKFSRDNHNSVSLTTIGSLCSRNSMPRADLSDYILAIADANELNPAAEWIDSKPWDGVDRLKPLADSLDPVDPEFACVLLRRWMIGAVGAAFNPEGMAMQGALVLQGKQYTGKTTWFWALVNWNKKLGKEGVSLDPSDRDSVKGAISHWIVELGELDATFKKSDIAALKQFITKDTDELFLRYSRAISTFPRRTAFFGTVNPAQYLHDETGNRRYWTIPCGDHTNAMHGIDVQQAWAQVKTLWAAGEQHRLTREEMERLNEANLHHTESNPIEELILTKFQWDGAPCTSPLTATEVLVAIGYDKPNNKQAKDTGAILRKLTGGEPKKYGGRSVFMMPPRSRHGQANDDDMKPF